MAPAKLEKADSCCQCKKLTGITLNVKDKGVNIPQGWESYDENGRDVVHDEAPEGGIERARGREQTGVREEALAGNFLVHSCL